jgi:hypothetical protein
VEGRVTDCVRYDSSTDSFKHLQLYTDLHSSHVLDLRHLGDPAAARQKDLQHLADLWSRRKDTITNPIEVRLFSFSGPTVYERTGKHTYRAWPTERAPNKPPKEERTPIDLDSIFILPGQFFLTEDKRLACYHQVIVPGKTVDQLLQHVARPQLIERLAQAPKHEVAMARKPNARRLTWSETRKQLAGELLCEKPAKNNPKEKPQETFGPFDNVTLNLWSSPTAEESVKLWRVRDRFTARIPLSPNDSSEAVATINFLKQEIAQHAEKELQPLGRILVELVQVREIKGVGIEITLNLTALLGRVMKLILKERLPQRDHKVDDDDPGEKVYQATVAFIRGKGIPINERLAIDDLIAEYTDSAFAQLFRGWGPLWLGCCLVVFVLSAWSFVRRDRAGVVRLSRLHMLGSTLAIALVAMLLCAGVLASLLEIPDWWLPLIQMGGGLGQFVVALGLAGLMAFWTVVLLQRVKREGHRSERRQVLRRLFFATCIELLLALAVSVHVWKRDLGASAMESWTGLVFGLVALLWIGAVCSWLFLLRWWARRQALRSLPPLPPVVPLNEPDAAIQAEFLKEGEQALPGGNKEQVKIEARLDQVPSTFD